MRYRFLSRVHVVIANIEFSVAKQFFIYSYITLVKIDIQIDLKDRESYIENGRIEMKKKTSNTCKKWLIKTCSLHHHFIALTCWVVGTSVIGHITCCLIASLPERSDFYLQKNNQVCNTEQRRGGLEESGNDGFFLSVGAKFLRIVVIVICNKAVLNILYSIFAI